MKWYFQSLIASYKNFFIVYQKYSSNHTALQFDTKILQIFQNCDANVYVKLYYKYFLVMLDTVTAEDNMTPAFSYRT